MRSVGPDTWMVVTRAGRRELAGDRSGRMMGFELRSGGSAYPSVVMASRR
jgi:hypothetical protein